MQYISCVCRFGYTSIHGDINWIYSQILQYISCICGYTLDADTQVYMNIWMHFRIQIVYRFGYKGRYG